MKMALWYFIRSVLLLCVMCKSGQFLEVSSGHDEKPKVSSSGETKLECLAGPEIESVNSWNPGELTVNWTALPDDCDVDRYVLTFQSKGSKNHRNVYTKNTSVIIPRLQTCTIYEVSIYAQLKNGMQSDGGKMVQSPVAGVYPPRSFAVEENEDGALVVKWSHVETHCISEYILDHETYDPTTGVMLMSGRDYGHKGNNYKLENVIGCSLMKLNLTVIEDNRKNMASSFLEVTIHTIGKLPINGRVNEDGLVTWEWVLEDPVKELTLCKAKWFNIKVYPDLDVKVDANIREYQLEKYDELKCKNFKIRIYIEGEYGHNHITIEHMPTAKECQT